MYQIDTIAAAVQLCLYNQQPQLVPAVLKHYLMDEKYVPKDARQEILGVINNNFEMTFSMSGVKRANPAMLNKSSFELPKKDYTIVVESLTLTDKLDLDSGPITLKSAHQTPAVPPQEETFMSAQKSQPAAETATKPAVSIEERSQANARAAGLDDSIHTEEIHPGKALSKVFLNALTEAMSKKKLKKENEHLDFGVRLKDINSTNVIDVYQFLKPSIKFLSECFKSAKCLKDQDARLELFEEWLDENKDRRKSFDEYEKALDKKLEKDTNIMAVFLLTSNKNMKGIMSFINFAMAHKPKKETSSFSFMRENESGIRGGWVAAGVAAAAGAADCLSRGLSVGSMAGGAVGIVVSYVGGELIDGQVENEIMRVAACSATGLLVGVGTTRLGRRLVPGPAFYDGLRGVDMVEASATTEVMVVPAVMAVEPAPVEPSKPGFFEGLVGSLM